MEYGNSIGFQFFFSDSEGETDTFTTPKFRAIEEKLLCVTVPSSTSSPLSFLREHNNNLTQFEEPTASPILSKSINK